MEEETIITIELKKPDKFGEKIKNFVNDLYSEISPLEVTDRFGNRIYPEDDDFLSLLQNDNVLGIIFDKYMKKREIGYAKHKIYDLANEYEYFVKIAIDTKGYNKTLDDFF